MRDESRVNKARHLRRQGLSKQAIASELGVTSSIISRWCGEIAGSKVNGIIDYYQKQRNKFLLMDNVSVEELTPDKARLYSSLLYWCEGSKYPSNNVVCFTSSDGVMQKLFIALLRKGFELEESKFRVWLQFHSDQNKEAIFKYWSKILGIPTPRFIKPMVTKKMGGKYRKIYYGTCSLRYLDYSLLLRLMGIYKRFADQTLALLV